MVQIDAMELGPALRNSLAIALAHPASAQDPQNRLLGGVAKQASCPVGPPFLRRRLFRQHPEEQDRRVSWGVGMAGTLPTAADDDVFGDSGLDNSIIRVQFVYGWHDLMENMKKLRGH
jgi:hypothetical protein